jgi:heme/copper-type cytochrome/quinol oxidase subunit 2
MVFLLEFAEPHQKLFQDSATPMMNGILDLHHYIFMFLTAIFSFVLVMLFFIIYEFIFKFSNILFNKVYLGKRLLRQKAKTYYRIFNQVFHNFYKKALFFYLVGSKYKNFINFKNKFFSKGVALKNLIRKKLVSNLNIIIFWNSFWDMMNIATVNYFTYTKRFRMFDEFLLTPALWLVLNWSIPVKHTKKFDIGLVESTIDNEKSEDNLPSDINLRTEAAFLTALYHKLYKYNVSYPFTVLTEAKQVFERTYMPKASRTDFIIFIILTTAKEKVAITNSYISNLFYKLYVYSIIKSDIYKFTHNTSIEIIWTIIPSVVLVLIGIPSFILLYAIDEIINPDFIVKCIGHQWYWSYEVERFFSARKEFKFSHPFMDSFIDSSFYKNYEFCKILGFVPGRRPNPDNTNYIFGFYMYLKIFENFYKITTSIINGNDNDILNYSNTLLFTKGKLLFNKGDKFIELFINLDNVKNKKISEINFSECVKNEDRAYTNFTSYMVNESDLNSGNLRLLEVDNPLYIPLKSHIDLLVTSDDVLHSWTIPSFGIKCDAVPGRLNHSNLFVERAGIYYGQCSEICGVNHGFMPIKVIVKS